MVFLERYDCDFSYMVAFLSQHFLTDWENVSLVGSARSAIHRFKTKMIIKLVYKDYLLPAMFKTRYLFQSNTWYNHQIYPFAKNNHPRLERLIDWLEDVADGVARYWI